MAASCVKCRPLRIFDWQILALLLHLLITASCDMHVHICGRNMAVVAGIELVTWKNLVWQGLVKAQTGNIDDCLREAL